MKEEKPTQHKRLKRPLYIVMDGWNFGIGFWMSFVASFVIIIPAIATILWIIFILFGSVLTRLLL